MKPDDPRHGTPAGAKKHRRDGERPCESCREAWRAYMHAYRQDPDVRARQSAGMRAASRAAWRLVDMHHDTYEALYAQELAAEHVREATS